MGRVDVTETKANLDKQEIESYINNNGLSDEKKEVIKGIFAVDSSNQDEDINIDFADLEFILENGDNVFVGSGEFEGENPAFEAVKSSIENVSLDYNSMNKITRLLVHFIMHPDLAMMEIAKAIEIIHDNVHSDAEIIWGTRSDETVNKNYVKATILFTEL